MRQASQSDIAATGDVARSPAAATHRTIELHLRELNQLFDPLDGSPLNEKDLARNVEAYLVDGAKELPGMPDALVVHLERPPQSAEAESAAKNAIHLYMSRRAALLRRDLRALLHRGRVSLCIGVGFLIALFCAGQLVPRIMGEGAFASLLREGLVIIGWVAMWRPLEIFLYDWWPVLGERRMYDRLSRMSVRIVSSRRESDDALAALPLARPGAEGGQLSPRAEHSGSDARLGESPKRLYKPPLSTSEYVLDNQGVYVKSTLFLQALLVLGLVLFVVKRDWENVFLTVTVIGLTVLPAFVMRRYRVYVPPEFQLIAVAFVFLSLFLGSAGDFYYRFWWWDIVLHVGSGFLLGIVGWITLFMMNETDRLPPGVRPEFLCFFGVTFAVFLGVLWEVFEFAVDRLAPGVNMQSLETGIVDTMQDLMVDLAGAVIVALMGLAYARSGRYSFLVDAVRRFMRMNRRLFRKSDEPPA